MDIANWIKKLWFCWVLDCPLNVIDSVQGPLEDREINKGDGYDEFGLCERCGKSVHRDHHWLSDGEWRHE